MTPRTLFWLVLAIAEAAGIVALSMLLFAGESTAAAGVDRVSPGQDSRTVTTTPTAPVEAPATPTTNVPPPPGVSTTATPTATTSIGTLLLGNVRTSAAASIDNVSLSLFSGDATKPCADTNLYRQTDFAFPALAAGSYRLTARGSNLRQFEQAITIPDGTEVVRIEVVLEPSWLIKVLLLAPDGRPLADATKEDKDLASLAFFRAIEVVAAGQQFPEQMPSSETPFTVGRWSSSTHFPGRGAQALPARYAGTLEMTEDRSAFVAATMGKRVLAQTAVAAGQQEVTLTVDPQQMLAQMASVRLQVVNAATGTPVPDAKVGLNGAGSWRQPDAVDAEGVLQKSKLMPGRYRLSISAEGRIGPPFELDLEAGRLTDLGPVPIVKSFALRIVLSSTTGSGGDADVAGSLLPLDPPGHAAFRAESIGLYPQKGEITASLWPGRYRLRLTGKGVGVLRDIDTRQLGDAPLQIELQPEAKLHLDPSQLSEPTHVTMTATNGAVLLDRWVTWKGKWDVSLPAGDYRCTLQTMNGPLRTSTVSVPAAGASLKLQ